MKKTMVEGVKVFYPDEMSINETKEYANEEIEMATKNKKRLSKIEITIDEKDIKNAFIESTETSIIRSYRRITGYLSDKSNFNDAKAAELKDRVSHL